MANVVGLELLHALFHEEFLCKEDSIVCALHCLFINKLGLCFGNGDQWSKDDKGSELLPTGWINKDVYTLRYISNDASNKYLAKITKAGDDLIVTVLLLGKDDVACMTLNVNNYVTDNLKEFSCAYKNVADLATKFDGMVMQLLGKPSSKPENLKSDVHEPRMVNQRTQRPIASDMRNEYFPMVGQADLNPFSGGIGGGMLFDPNFRPLHLRPDQNFPRGSVPPGARFDPISGLPRRFPGPDPDHFSPPGYSDMFM